MPKINNINNETGSLAIDAQASTDAQINFEVNLTNVGVSGVDESASDVYKISHNTSLGTDDVFVLTQSGQRFLPEQPVFMAFMDPGVNTVTGAGTIYTAVWNNTQVNRGSHFDGTSTFTAPVDGNYTFNVAIRCDQTTVAMTRIYSLFNTSNLIYALNGGTVGPIRYPTALIDDMGNSFTVTVPMDAMDTCTYQVVIFNGASDAAGFGVPNSPAAEESTWWSGILEM